MNSRTVYRVSTWMTAVNLTLSCGILLAGFLLGNDELLSAAQLGFALVLLLCGLHVLQERLLGKEEA